MIPLLILAHARLRSRRHVRWAAALVLAMTVLLPAEALAQVPVPAEGDTIYVVELDDGSRLIGHLLEASESVVVVRTLSGARVEVDRARVARMQAGRGRGVNGEYWETDGNSTRLFFTSTGRALGQGEAYVGTYFLFLPFVAVGVTDDFTLAAGAPVLFGEFEPVYIAPKLRVVDTEAVNLSLGTILFLFDEEAVGIAYGVGTFGSEDHAVTAGVGFGYSGDEFESQPVAMIGAETRMSRRTKLVTENYFLPGETGVVFSGGIRIVGRRFSSDFGVFGYVDEFETYCCLPVINVSYAFGR